ncbi:GNAT family N-acetyltransferase [Psychrobacillus sp. NPDC096426]|uniref:GNAT family N-acetyltransferase n=1 Tax=Psychrobacillus sp. NPDC096426 TaxID=3364491 RepID=UPI00380649DF
MINDLVIDEMLETDWEQVKTIYIEGIQSGNATFQTKAPTWNEWNAVHFQKCRFIARMGREVVGWIAISPISSRESFAGVAEISIYLTNTIKGMGIGSKLLEALVKDSEQLGFWTLQAMIFPENQGSINLHKKFNFKEVGTRQRIGKLNGVWRDVVLLERRSEKVGQY